MSGLRRASSVLLRLAVLAAVLGCNPVFVGISAAVRRPPAQRWPEHGSVRAAAASVPVMEDQVAEVADKVPSALHGVRPDLAAKLGRVPEGILDEAEALRKSTFPIPPEELIGLAKAWIASQSDDDGVDWFAEDFRFVAPVVGPFEKEEFVDSLKSFELKQGFPDISSNFHHFRVDPFEPNRVWYSVKFTGRNTGPIMGRPATGKSVESPVQAQSLTFNERGEITKFTIGYVLDKETGNTGGLGGVFGLLYGIGYGLPFPEAQPWKPSPIYGTAMKGNKVFQDIFKANPQVKEAFQAFLSGFGK